MMVDQHNLLIISDQDETRPKRMGRSPKVEGGQGGQGSTKGHGGQGNIDGHED